MPVQPPGRDEPCSMLAYTFPLRQQPGSSRSGGIGRRPPRARPLSLPKQPGQYLQDAIDLGLEQKRAMISGDRMGSQGAAMQVRPPQFGTAGHVNPRAG